MTWFNDEQNWPPEWSPDYNHYEIIKFARSESFGAIRRAAEVARHWQNDQEEICGEAAAFYVRQAIRAAIRSSKV